MKSLFAALAFLFLLAACSGETTFSESILSAENGERLVDSSSSVVDEEESEYSLENEMSSSFVESSSSFVDLNADSTAFTDYRDGQIYKVTKIGRQIWMAENLNYNIEGSYCYNNDSLYCKRFGRLYPWTLALSVCPDGWHLPANEEWETLFESVGGESIAGLVLKSKTGWYEDGDGTDDFGFTAIASPNHNGFGFADIEDDDVNYWSSTKNSNGELYHMYLNVFDEGAFLRDDGTEYSFSVRCLRD